MSDDEQDVQDGQDGQGKQEAPPENLSGPDVAQSPDQTSIPAEDDWASALAEQVDAGQEGGGDDWGAALAEQVDHERESLETKTKTKRAEFPDFPMESPETSPRAITELDVILDIPVTISMEVGSTTITIRNLLKLNQGSVIELDRLAGEPLDVLVNGTLIAHGEVVVVNEKFGIRLTDVMSAAERIQKIE